MTTSVTNKLEKLYSIIHSYQSVLIAFSGGCDSSFVLKVSREVLRKEKVKAVIAQSPSLPEAELEEAKKIAREVDAELAVIQTHELEDPSYAANPINRCYFCKSELYSHLIPLAEKWGLRFVVNGTNQDDLGDWRPGLKAAQDYQVRSPLVEAGITKEEVRRFSRELGLSTWSKPQAACLASRFPSGVALSRERLKQVELGEKILKDLGFRVVRLRWLGEEAMIEVGLEETNLFFQNPAVREEVFAELRQLGFREIRVDLAGYRPGRFNPS